MANFSMFEVDDYSDIFITESSLSDKCKDVVSLEDNGEFRTVRDPNLLT